MNEQLQLGLADGEGREPGEAVRTLAPGAVLFRGLVLGQARRLLEEIERIAAVAPFRHLITPGGFRMSVAMTNCGPLGWVSDRSGYRYAATDPETGKPWPAMPEAFRTLASTAAEQAGFGGFHPDACLINRYEVGARLSLHQDRDERGYDQPIVSVSLGLPAVFSLGGLERRDRPERVPLVHGDVVVLGGPSRLRFHGVQPISAGEHPLVGSRRLNLTFRRAR